MVTEFLNELEKLYTTGKPEQTEAYLKQGIEKAALAGDGKAVFSIMNELAGFYRVCSRFEECFLCIEQLMELVKLLGIKGTAEEGTMLLNAATGYRAAGKYEEAERYYREVQKIYTQELPAGDFRTASLCNNMSLLYLETGRPEEALRELQKAMEILQGLPGADMEIAVTHTNLGTTFFRLGRNAEGIRYMKEAADFFERVTDRKDAHYSAALSGLGEAYYRQGDLIKAAEYFSRALEETQRMYGENQDARTIRKNLLMVQGLLDRQKAVESTSGMEISRKYYECFGAPMLEKRYPEYAGRIAVGLVGEGSECMGFDDPYSTDHDFGPGFCLWLTKEDDQVIGNRLQEDYEKLPGKYLGLEAKHRSDHGKDRVGVFCMDDFFRKYTGHAQAPRDEESWMKIPEDGLLAVTDGEIFRDDLGEFRRKREGFLHFPPRIRQKKLAFALGRMAQSGQYNLGRSRKRKDLGAMYLSLAEFVNAAAETAYLLNDRYLPFYKWRMQGMEDFRCLRDLKEMLEILIQISPDDEAADMEIEKICRKVVRELNSQGISGSRDLFLENQKKQILENLKGDSGHGKEEGTD